MTKDEFERIISGTIVSKNGVLYLVKRVRDCDNSPWKMRLYNTYGNLVTWHYAYGFDDSGSVSFASDGEVAKFVQEVMKNFDNGFEKLIKYLEFEEMVLKIHGENVFGGDDD